MFFSAKLSGRRSACSARTWSIHAMSSDGFGALGAAPQDPQVGASAIGEAAFGPPPRDGKEVAAAPRDGKDDAGPPRDGKLSSVDDGGPPLPVLPGFFAPRV